MWVLGASDTAVQVAWVGVITVAVSGAFGGLIAWISNRAKNAVVESKETVGVATGQVVNVAEVFADLKAERDRNREERVAAVRRAEELAEAAAESVARADRAERRADQAEARADRADRRAAQAEARADRIETDLRTLETRIDDTGKAE